MTVRFTAILRHFLNVKLLFVMVTIIAAAYALHTFSAGEGLWSHKRPSTVASSSNYSQARTILSAVSQVNIMNEREFGGDSRPPQSQAGNQSGRSDKTDKTRGAAATERETPDSLSAHDEFLSARQSPGLKEVPSVVLAAQFGDLETVNKLIQDGASADSADPRGITGLMCAARTGNVRIVESLLSMGARIDIQDYLGMTAAMYAASNGKTEVLEALVRKGANPDLKSSVGGTLLHAAVLSGNLRTVQLALSTRQDLNAQTQEGATALVMASEQRFPQIVALLVRAGADVNVRTNYSVTALLAQTLDDTAYRPATLESVSLLIEAGANVNARDSKGRTALMGTALYGSADVARYLVGHGADVQAIDSRGRTALSIANAEHKSEIIELLKGVSSEPEK